MSQEAFVTHYYRRSPDPKGWIQTMFLTQRKGDENYYLGSGDRPFPQSKIEQDLDNGSLKAVTPSPIHKGETLWITSEQDIGIGSSTNPFETTFRVIDKDNVSVNPQKAEASPTSWVEDLRYQDYLKLREAQQRESEIVR